jgi:hypothetical protein
MRKNTISKVWIKVTTISKRYLWGWIKQTTKKATDEKKT